MLSIGKFFERIQNVRTKELFIRSVIRDAIKKHVSVEIPVESIALKSSDITLKNINSSLRSAIFIKKQTLIAEINAAQAIRSFTDIR